MGVAKATILPIGLYPGEKHQYALTIDISELTDATQPTAKVNIVIDNEIIKSVSIQDMLQGRFSI